MRRKEKFIGCWCSIVQLVELLEVVFEEDRLILTDKVNLDYLRLCNQIDGILFTLQEFSVHLFLDGKLNLKWRPYDDLRSFLGPLTAHIDWTGRARILCGKFLTVVEETFIEMGEKEYPLEPDDQQLLNQIQIDFKEYQSYKKTCEAQSPEGTDRVDMSPQIDLPQFDFNFVTDEKIKDLLISDWQEVQKAFKHGLYKSTVVLCGAIIEALLIGTLYLIESDAKIRFDEIAKKRSWKRSPPEKIESWYTSELISVAEEEQIISRMAAGDSYLVKNYRNFIHLYAQKRDGAPLREDTVSTILSFVRSLYSDISEWHQKQRS